MIGVAEMVGEAATEVACAEYADFRFGGRRMGRMGHLEGRNLLYGHRRAEAWPMRALEALVDGVRLVFQDLRMHFGRRSRRKGKKGRKVRRVRVWNEEN